MATATRIYEVKDEVNHTSFLVKAATKAQAIGHVVKNSYSAEVPSADRLVELVQGGMKVEEAGAEQGASE